MDIVREMQWVRGTKGPSVVYFELTRDQGLSQNSWVPNVVAILFFGYDEKNTKSC